MKEDQTKWKSWDQQSQFIKAVIAPLVEKHFGALFKIECQGCGEVAILVISGSDVKKISKIKKFFVHNYKIELHKINGHGNTKGTIVVNLSEITNTTRKIIEDEFHQKIFLPKSIENKKINAKQTLTILPYSIEVPKVIVEEIQTQTETKNPLKMEKEKFSLIKKGRNLLLSFLTAMFRFEEIISDAKDRNFEFDEKKTEDCQSISFSNEAEAEMAYSAIVWLHKDTCKDLPVLGEKEVMVNFFSLSLEREIRSANISFCHPPVKGETVERIQKRAIRVLAGYRPSHVYIIDENSFSIGYARQATTQNFLELISRMGWEAYSKEDIIICKFRPKPEVPEVTTPIVESVSKTEEVSMVVKETENKIFKESFVSPRSASTKKADIKEPKVEILKPNPKVEEPKNQPEEVIILKADDLPIPFVKTSTEAWVALKRLYSDPVLFSRISSELQKEIINEIRNNFIEEHTEDYARSLLAFLRK